jgi:hypothetical protein
MNSSLRKKPEDGWPSAWIDGAPLYSCTPTEELTTLVADDTFHIGQCYDSCAAKIVECSRCRGREFNVGQGKYFTAIRCVKCAWECCIHDG